MITIKEIARLSNVSAGTVDRVLHNRGRVSKETESRIRRVAEEHGYVPNLVARRLQSNRHFVFGVLIPDPESEYGYWQQVVEGVEDARKEIEAMDASVIYSFFDRHDPESFDKAASELLQHDVSAYIVAPIIADGMRRLADTSVPYAFIDSSLPDLEPMWDFSQDPVAAGKTGARLMCLSAMPLSKVITIQTHKGAFNGEMRAAAFASSLAVCKPALEVDNIYSDTPEELEALLFEAAGCEEAFGVFVVNDQASVVCQVLERLSLLERACVIGFDLSAENRECLSTGKIFAVIGQRPRTQGHDAVMTIYNYFMLSRHECGSFSAPVDIYIRENIPRSNHWL